MSVIANCYELSLSIEVFDKNALATAALISMIENGSDRDEAKEQLGIGGEIDVQNCLRQLLDPGMPPPGCKILDSTCE